MRRECSKAEVNDSNKKSAYSHMIMGVSRKVIICNCLMCAFLFIYTFNLWCLSLFVFIHLVSVWVCIIKSTLVLSEKHCIKMPPIMNRWH